MDWTVAIDRQRNALKGVLATLVAMAMVTAWHLAAGIACTLTRRVRAAILRVLLPAESAARRLVVASARGIVVALRAPSGGRRAPGPARPGSAVPPVPRPLCLPLFDPFRNPFRRRRSYVPAHRAPRIVFFGPEAPPPYRLPKPPADDDEVDATRIVMRLAALGRALDDLPRLALRFARWQARRAAGLTRRLVPLRPGRAYASRKPEDRRPPRRIDDILYESHWLAREALADTS